MNNLPEYWNELNASDKLYYIEGNSDWKYIFYGNGCSSGVWDSETQGSINLNGGAFYTIAQALESFERYTINSMMELA